ncbi:hypothetical protein CHS0354_012202 [Potamilus streckersoni]|uniref:HMG box domain-containing protein n=1 Tax=Potamilus streckersoni TaxID=2493646 RepID=A0AAE0SAQ6_9BIVA|nr:hypothetical protein CHS0354_012202 [Potamilus streckersoni]
MMAEPSLKALPSEAVRLIGSSQVITSVYSVVKELVENSLDARATSMEVKLENFGLNKIEVRDNGCGINHSEMHLVAKKHHTSKISAFTDLEKLQTFGFRGEALGSLCSVSSIQITTKTAVDDVSITYSFDNQGKITSSQPSHLGQGTSVCATNLFKNMPVRRQFYNTPKKKKEELKKVEDLLMSFGAICPNIRLYFRHDKDIVWQKPAMADTKAVLQSILGRNIVEQMKHLKTPTESEIILDAFLPKPNSDVQITSRSTNDRGFIFVNRRPVELKEVEKCVRQYYMGCHACDSLRYPIFFLSIKVPSNELDVNLDPNKMNVLLHQQNEVLTQIRQMLKDLYGPLKEDMHSSSVISRNDGKRNDSVKPFTAQNNGCHSLESQPCITVCQDIVNETCRNVSSDTKSKQKDNNDLQDSFDYNLIFQSDSSQNNNVANMSSGFENEMKGRHVKNISIKNSSLVQGRDDIDQCQTQVDKGCFNLINNENGLLTDILHEDNGDNTGLKSSDVNCKNQANNSLMGKQGDDLPILTQGKLSDENRERKSNLCMNGNITDKTEVVTKDVDSCSSRNVSHSNSSISEPGTLSSNNTEVNQISVKEMETFTVKVSPLTADWSRGYGIIQSDGKAVEPVKLLVPTGGKNCETLGQTTLGQGHEKAMETLRELGSGILGQADGVHGNGTLGQAAGMHGNGTLGQTSGKRALLSPERSQIAGLSAKKRILSVQPDQPRLYDLIGKLPVQRPLKGFVAFSKEIRPKVIEENPEASYDEVTHIVKKRWEKLSEDDKLNYGGAGLTDLRKQKQEKPVKMTRKVALTAGMISIKDQLLSACSPPHQGKRASTIAPLKTVQIRFGLEQLKHKYSRGIRLTQSQMPSEMQLIGPLKYYGSWMCFHNYQLLVLNPHRVEETLLHRELLENYGLPTKPLENPIELGERNVGGAIHWRILISMATQSKKEQTYFEIQDPRIVSNGMKIRCYVNDEGAFKLRLVELSKSVPTYGLKDLEEILELISNSNATSLYQARPNKVVYYLQGEAVRMARQRPLQRSKEDVLDLIDRMSAKLPADCQHCLHNKPFLLRIFNLGDISFS